MKRYLYIFIAVAGLIVVGLLAYYLYSRIKISPLNPATGTTGNLPPTPTQSNPTPTPPAPAFGSETPATGTNSGVKFGIIAQTPAVAYYVDSTNNAFLVQPDGQIVKVSGGSATTLSSSLIPNLISAQFSYDGAKVLAAFGDLVNPQFSIFDVASKSWQPLTGSLLGATWSPTNYQIAYFAQKNGALVLTTLDTGNAKATPASLLTIHAQDTNLHWIGTNQIILAGIGSAFTNTSALLFDLKAKTLTPLAIDRAGLDSLWSGAAGMGLVFESGSNQIGGSLSLVDLTGNTLTKLSVLTLPSKCLFNTALQAPSPTNPVQATSTKGQKTPVAPLPVLIKTLYCAIPNDTQTLAASTLPDDYAKKVIFTADDFYKIGLADGSLTQVFSGASQMLDATDLQVFNQNLFFINRIDQKLYAISLK